MKRTAIAAALAVASFNLFAQPYTGAGSTMNQPSAQYQRWAEQQRLQSQQYYWRPAPPAPVQPQTRYIPYPDSSLRAIGYPPVPVQLSPQAADRIYGCTTHGLPGAMWGGIGGLATAHGGRPAQVRGAVGGMAAGFAQGCVTR